MTQVEVQREFAAPREEVFERYTDHLSFWEFMGSVRLEKEGSPNKNGLGCIRVIGSPPMSAFEEVVAFDPPERMNYRVIKGGLGIKNHLGEVSFEETATGTRILWRCRFDAKIPGLGPLLRIMITRVFRGALERFSTQFEEPNASTR